MFCMYHLCIEETLWQFLQLAAMVRGESCSAALEAWCLHDSRCFRTAVSGSYSLSQAILFFLSWSEA